MSIGEHRHLYGKKTYSFYNQFYEFLCKRYIKTHTETVDCKTVRSFAYSRKREQSNERSGTRLKTESETGERRWACEARALRACTTLTPRFTDFLTDFEKKTDCFAV